MTGRVESESILGVEGPGDRRPLSVPRDDPPAKLVWPARARDPATSEAVKHLWCGGISKDASKMGRRQFGYSRPMARDGKEGAVYSDVFGWARGLRPGRGQGEGWGLAGGVEAGWVVKSERGQGLCGEGGSGERLMGEIEV